MLIGFFCLFSSLYQHLVAEFSLNLAYNGCALVAQRCSELMEGLDSMTWGRKGSSTTNKGLIVAMIFSEGLGTLRK